MKRRTFIKKCSLSALGITGTASLLSACQTNEVRSVSTLVTEEGELVISKSQFSGQQYILLDHPEHSHPICVFKTGNNEYTASLMSCTHQKCTTAVVDEQFVCPCHGSRFSSKGVLLRGPAERDLTTYRTQVTDESILISLG